MPNIPKINSTSESPSITLKIFVATKQWVYEICEKIARTHAEARSLAFLVTLWLEYLYFNPNLFFSVPFCPRYIQLFALLLLDITLEKSGELRKRCPTENLFKLAFTGFSPQEVQKLQAEIEILDMYATVKSEPLLKYLELLLLKIPQTAQIRNASLILLDAFNLQYFSINVEKTKVAAACVAVARFWVSEKKEQTWLSDYPSKTGLSMVRFREYYDQVYGIASMINKKNLSKKKKSEIIVGITPVVLSEPINIDPVVTNHKLDAKNLPTFEFVVQPST